MLSFGLQKHQPYVFSSFQTFRYVGRTLIHGFLNLETSCVHGLLNLTSKNIIPTLLLALGPLLATFTAYFRAFYGLF